MRWCITASSKNYAQLRKQLILEGHDFVSETDTEVLTHLIEKYYHNSLEAAVRQTLAVVRGSRLPWRLFIRMNPTR